MKSEHAIVYRCEGDSLIGIVHEPSIPNELGVLIIVGGPQYRVGSHRQFLLLARDLAESGFPAMRFDYRGMGDCGEGIGHFESIESDIRSSIDAFCARGVRRIVIWGLCDAASAALMYAHSDPRVIGLVILNPWVRTDAGMARAYMKHYYLQRLVSAEFWHKVLAGKFSLGASLRGFAELIRKLRSASASNTSSIPPDAPNEMKNGPPTSAFVDQMALGWEKFGGAILLILSGNQDYVADEFRDLVARSRRWKKLVKRANVQRRDFSEANHTFSSADWRNNVSKWTREWLIEKCGK